MTDGPFFDSSDIADFLRAGGHIDWADWISMSDDCRIAFKSAGDAVLKERLAILVFALQGQDFAARTISLLLGEQMDLDESLLSALADDLARENQHA